MALPSGERHYRPFRQARIVASLLFGMSDLSLFCARLRQTRGVAVSRLTVWSLESLDGCASPGASLVSLRDMGTGQGPRYTGGGGGRSPHHIVYTSKLIGEDCISHTYPYRSLVHNTDTSDLPRKDLEVTHSSWLLAEHPPAQLHQFGVV